MSRLAITCPICKRPLATSPAFAGQMIACPHCRGEFVLTLPVVTPAQVAAPETAPPAFRLESPSSSTAAAPVALVRPPEAAAPPASPQPPPKTARFKVAAAQSPALTPAADGKLPGLQLADAAAPEGQATGQDKAVPMWLACLAVAASTVVSAALLLYTPPEAQSIAEQRAAARRDIAQFYGSDAAQLRPYQVLLREAQQAHSRGDHAVEQQRYRDVLRLLRAEGRSKFEGLTGTPDSDERLYKLLAILLGAD
jgi:hypothetical protein